MRCCWLFLHRWSKWEPYKWQGEQFSVSNLTGIRMDSYEVTEDRQKRHCERCGLTQDRMIES